MNQHTDFTTGSITGQLLRFSLPLMLGNLLQQLYNIVDTLIVGRTLGEQALAAVGSAYTLMIFLTSIIGGLCMGSGVYFSIQYGKRRLDEMKQAFFISFVAIFGVTMCINALAYGLLGWITRFMRIPKEVVPIFEQYLAVIFAGIPATFLYNYFANLLQSVGNSVLPLVFLGVSTVANIVLDLLFIMVLHWGVAGAAAATVIAQYLAGLGILAYYLLFCRPLHTGAVHRRWNRGIFKEIAKLSSMTCIQQSIMNLGILMVQGLVNSFGTNVMAAFAAGVKIDTVAYAPVQDFGNAFSTFVAQNFGAGKKERIREGIHTVVKMVVVFCVLVSSIVCCFAKQLMGIFVEVEKTEVIRIGAEYLHIEGACYIGIGILFLLYGYYRAVKKPGMSVVLTVISLGTRVVLAYLLSALPFIGVTGIWAAIPIGWVLADVTGIIYMRRISAPKSEPDSDCAIPAEKFHRHF